MAQFVCMCAHPSQYCCHRIDRTNICREALRSAQLAERLALEDEHAAEYAHLESSCKERLDRYNEKAKQLLDTMRARHEEELSELENITNNGTAGNVKYRYAMRSYEPLVHSIQTILLSLCCGASTG